MKKLSLVFVAVGLFAAFKAQAIVDIGAHYSLYTGNPSTFNSAIDPFCSGSSCGSPFKGTAGMGLDVVIYAPLVPIGFGIRYESLNTTVSGSGLAGSFSFKYAFTRTAALINYRFINTLVYLGPIATYGISNASTLKFDLGGTTLADMTAGTNSSYTVGLEAGVKLLLFTLGAEVGYSSLASKDYKTSSGGVLTIAGNSVDNIALNGTYAMINLGLSF